MRRYLIRRLLQTILLLFILSVVLFSLLHAIPGGPVRALIGPRATKEQIASITHDLGLDQPLYIQYWNWITNILHGNLGTSFASGLPVSFEIGTRVGNTLELFLAAMAFAMIVAILLGVLSAVRQYSIMDYSATIFAYFGIAMPIFWFALVLQQIFGVKLGVLPIFGQQSLNTTGFSPLDNFEDHLVHLILPMITLSLLFIAGWSRYLRSSMLDVVKQDYVRTARAKGLSPRVVFFKHALRNALIPFITVVAIDFGGIASGAAVTETVYSWPGLGSRFLDALSDRDYPVLLAMLLISAASVILFNLIADLLYAVVDPRIRYS